MRDADGLVRQGSRPRESAQRPPTASSQAICNTRYWQQLITECAGIQHIRTAADRTRAFACSDAQKIRCTSSVSHSVSSCLHARIHQEDALGHAAVQRDHLRPIADGALTHRVASTRDATTPQSQFATLTATSPAARGFRAHYSREQLVRGHDGTSPSNQPTKSQNSTTPASRD